MLHTYIPAYLPTYLPAYLPACLPTYIHAYTHIHILYNIVHFDESKLYFTKIVLGNGHLFGDEIYPADYTAHIDHKGLHLGPLCLTPSCTTPDFYFPRFLHLTPRAVHQELHMFHMAQRRH